MGAVKGSKKLSEPGRCVASIAEPKPGTTKVSEKLGVPLVAVASRGFEQLDHDRIDRSRGAPKISGLYRWAAGQVVSVVVHPLSQRYDRGFAPLQHRRVCTLQVKIVTNIKCTCATPHD